MKFAKEIAQRENCYKIMLLTGSKSKDTLHFYEQAGYCGKFLLLRHCIKRIEIAFLVHQIIKHSRLDDMAVF